MSHLPGTTTYHQSAGRWRPISRNVFLGLGWLGLCWLLSGCAVPLTSGTPPISGSNQPSTGEHTATALPSEPTTPPATTTPLPQHPAAATAAAVTNQVAAPGVCTVAIEQPAQEGVVNSYRGTPAQGVIYDSESHTIYLEDMPPTTLAAVSAALERPDLLWELAPGEWILSAHLEVGPNATLLIAAPEVRWLKMRSDAEGFVWLKAIGGSLTLRNTCVSSWNPDRQSFDEDYENGRSYVLARDGAHMEIRSSELRHLGYAADESYGVAFRLEGTSGLVIDSQLAYNYYGLYTYEVSDLVIRRNEVHHSVLYGIDPHTDSNRLLIENNVVHHNGKHGIILANRCSNSIVRGNVAYNNGLHGIVLYQQSNDNIVEYNTSYDNQLQGININDASHNIVRYNVVYDNNETGIGVGQDAEHNLVTDNRVHDNNEHGVYFYSEATRNTARQNLIYRNAEYGIYIKSEDNRVDRGNQVFENQIGVYFNVDETPDIEWSDNQVYANQDEDIRIDN